MYESYFAADPSTHTPPIPTTRLLLSHPKERESELCYLAETTSSEREAAKTALIDAILNLEHGLAADHPVRGMVEGNSDRWMGSYIIKREYSEGSHNVLGIKVPELTPVTASLADPLAHSSNAAHAAVSAANVGSTDHQQHAGNVSTKSSNQGHAQHLQQLTATFKHIQAAAGRLICFLVSFCHDGSHSLSAGLGPDTEVIAKLQPFPSQSADSSSELYACANPDLAAQETSTVIYPVSSNGPAEHSSRAYAGFQVLLELNALLDETADKLLQQSCGEGWLVQPRIANMSGLEYRVYILGGASAVSALTCYLLQLPPAFTDPAGLFLSEAASEEQSKRSTELLCKPLGYCQRLRVHCANCTVQHHVCHLQLPVFWLLCATANPFDTQQW